MHISILLYTYKIQQSKKPDNQRPARKNIRNTHSDVHSPIIVLEPASVNRDTRPSHRIPHSIEWYAFHPLDIPINRNIKTTIQYEHQF